MNNKKGVSWTAGIIVSFVFVSLISMFTMVLIHQAGEDYLIEETANVGIDILNDTVASPASSINAINQIRSDWSSLSFPYDLFFLFFWLTAITSTVFATFKANKEGIFSFFGYIFVGSMIVLLMTSYLATFSDWFLTQIFYNVFDDLTFSLPIFTFYMTNLGIINFVWWLSLVLISVIDRRFISRTGEVEE